MTRAYLAVIDLTGLRGLFPEDDAGTRRAAALRDRLRVSACCWAVLSGETASHLLALLEDGERRHALVTLATDALRMGPATPPAVGGPSPGIRLGS